MFYNKTFLLFLYILIYNIEGKPREIECSFLCKCDKYKNLRRATCNNKNLVVVDTGLAPETQVLDLSYNSIQTIEENKFREINLLSLKILNMTHNKLSNIHLNAFNGLTEVRTMDLSYNMIEKLIPQWFWSLPKLKELYLHGNRFMTSADIKIESKSLKILVLSSCAIAHIDVGTFFNTPNLEVLDLSGNFLRALDVEVIKPLQLLETFKLENNKELCKDDSIRKIRTFTTEEEITFPDPCPKSSKIGQKFEKMVMQEEEEQNAWIYDDETENITHIVEVEKCTVQEKDFITNIFELSPILSVVIILIVGFQFGLMIGCFTSGCCYKKYKNLEDTINYEDSVSHYRSSYSSLPIRKSRSSLGRSRMSLSGRNKYKEDETIMLNDVETFPESTPIPNRRLFI